MKRIQPLAGGCTQRGPRAVTSTREVSSQGTCLTLAEIPIAKSDVALFLGRGQRRWPARGLLGVGTAQRGRMRLLHTGMVATRRSLFSASRVLVGKSLAVVGAAHLTLALASAHNVSSGHPEGKPCR